MTKLRTITLGVLLGAFLLGGMADIAAQAQGGSPAGAPGARELLRSFFQAMGAADLALLKNGAAISGTIQGDQFTVKLDSGQTQTLDRDQIASITFGDTDQLVLVEGNILQGSLELDSLPLTSSDGTELSLAKDDIQMTIFKLNLPQGGGGQRGPNQALFRIFQGLRSQNIFGLFAQALTAFDMAVFPDGTLWSGAVLNDEFVFNTNLFGTLTLNAADLSAIDLASEEGASDFIILKTGDRISGQLDESSLIEFQPAGLTDDGGNPLTLTLEPGQFSRVTFRQPASAFGGGGRGPGFGGGPGN